LKLDKAPELSDAAVKVRRLEGASIRPAPRVCDHVAATIWSREVFGALHTPVELWILSSGANLNLATATRTFERCVEDSSKESRRLVQAEPKIRTDPQLVQRARKFLPVVAGISIDSFVGFYREFSGAIVASARIFRLRVMPTVWSLTRLPVPSEEWMR